MARVTPASPSLPDRPAPELQATGRTGASVSNRPAARVAVFQVTVLAGAHLVHDSYLALLGILLPLLVAKFELSLFLAGLLAPMQQSAALAQPVLGYLADRWNGRRFVVVCTATTGVLMSLIGLVPNYLTLALLLFAVGVSSAAYHPAGSSLLTRVVSGRWGVALAVYHLGGNLGLALGPLVITLVVGAFGLGGTYLVALPALLYAAVLWRVLPTGTAVVRHAVQESFFQLARAESRTFTLLAVAILARAAGSGGLTLFLPTYLLQEGRNFTEVGAIAAAFFAIGGLGGLATGFLSDRIGRKAVLITAFAASPIFLLTFLHASGPLSTLGLLLAAAFLLGEQPVLIALVQELAPHRRGTVVGFVMGMQFVCSGLATAGIGALADHVGLGVAFNLIAVAPLLAIPALVLLRPRPV